MDAAHKLGAASHVAAEETVVGALAGTGNGMELERTFTLHNKTGLHLRAAGKLAEAAGKFDSDVSAGNADRFVNAKSIVDLLTLGAVPGAHITVRAKGDDADEALDTIGRLIAADFEE